MNPGSHTIINLHLIENLKKILYLSMKIYSATKSIIIDSLAAYLRGKACRTGWGWVWHACKSIFGENPELFYAREMFVKVKFSKDGNFNTVQQHIAKNMWHLKLWLKGKASNFYYS